MDLSVIGLGYVGLAVAVEAVRAGMSVLGVDIRQTVVDGLGAGSSHVDDITDEELRQALNSGLSVSVDPSALPSASAIIIAVPTPLTGGAPDLSYVRAVAITIGDHLQPGQLVVLESTSYPGTTEEIVLPILEEKSGLVAGVDFHLAFSPERIDPGNSSFGLRNTPKLVGGVDTASTQRAAALYRKFCDEVVEMSGTREAELAKLLENTYRHINIALVNEMAIFCNDMGIDLWEAIRGASTKPFGFEAFYPGPGVGGHCIPIDPNYLSHKVRDLGYPFRFVELAQEINARMPGYVVERAVRLLNDAGLAASGAHVVLLGVSYKRDVGDTRETPAAEIVRRLRRWGANVSFADPHVSSFSVDGQLLQRHLDPASCVDDAELVILLTDHTDFDLPGIARCAYRILDTRGAMSGPSVTRL